ncbi:MAG: hypothetical protein NTU88_02170, partial [Armatimonadetes bacterium]|nr:hypothetical protein [Armatimonadota bacterium]
MKRVLAVAVLALVVCGIATAAENNWRFNLMADNGNFGADAWAAMSIGVWSGTTYVSKDGNYTDSLWSDAQDQRFDTT